LKQVIGFDLDGVIARTDRTILRAVQQRGLLLNRTEDEITHFRYDHSFPGEIEDDVVLKILAEGNVYRDCERCTSLIDAVYDCRALGYEIQIVTARWENDQVERDTRDWLDRYCVPYDKLVIGVSSSHKHKYAEEAGLIAFVEDRHDTANRLAKVCLPFLVAMPYNDPANGHQVDRRVIRRDRSFFARVFPYLMSQLYKPTPTGEDPAVRTVRQAFEWAAEMRSDANVP
jgi:uncharacterized HAD superfamily protein